MNGTVTDATGSIVPGAKVEAVSADTGLRRETLTGAAGTYQMPALAIGTYTVSFSKTGFKTVEFEGVDLVVGAPRTPDARLEVGLVNESVQVTASPETINRSSAEVGGLIESEQIKEIPVSGRNWASLMLLAPGAINYGDGAQRSIRFSGHSLDDSNFAFDGVDTSGVCDRSSTNIDVRHTMTMNGVYQLPFGHGKQFLSGNGLASRLVSGWELAGIATARTGMPVNITISRKANALPD